MTRRRALLITLAGLPGAGTLLLGSGCAGLGGPTVITLGETELAGLVGRAFPLQRRVLELLDVQMSAPRLRLLPERNRLAVDLALQTQERLLGHSGRGQLQFDSALRWEAQDASIRLTQVRVQQIGFDGGGLPAGAAAAAAALPASGPASASQRLGRALAERMLEDLTVYRVSTERQASLRQMGLQPGAVTVTARGVEITLARSGG